MQAQTPPLFAPRKPAPPPNKEAASGGSIPDGGRLIATKDGLSEYAGGKIHLRGLRTGSGRQNRQRTAETRKTAHSPPERLCHRAEHDGVMRQSLRDCEPSGGGVPVHRMNSAPAVANCNLGQAFSYLCVPAARLSIGSRPTRNRAFCSGSDRKTEKSGAGVPAKSLTGSQFGAGFPVQPTPVGRMPFTVNGMRREVRRAQAGRGCVDLARPHRSHGLCGGGGGRVSTSAGPRHGSPAQPAAPNRGPAPGCRRPPEGGPSEYG